ncbi:hypothetical protein RJT34_24426 [Clitoria ternatea]|uniref:Uncharacterized protein n=1 Tax=Clitoria ternatea TaxID=43366 RepID=A0AAN9FQR5_CLITE
MVSMNHDNCVGPTVPNTSSVVGSQSHYWLNQLVWFLSLSYSLLSLTPFVPCQDLILHCISPPLQGILCNRNIQVLIFLFLFVQRHCLRTNYKISLFAFTSGTLIFHLHFPFLLFFFLCF